MSSYYFHFQDDLKPKEKLSSVHRFSSSAWSTSASAAASPSESARKTSAPKLKLCSEVDSAFLHLQPCFYFHATAWCQRPTLATSAVDSTPGEQTAHVKLFIFHRTALLAETYTLYQLSQQWIALWGSSHRQDLCTVSTLPIRHSSRMLWINTTTQKE